MLTKKHNGIANGPRISKALAGLVGGSMDRRQFLKRSGLTAGGAALASTLPGGMVKKAAAQSATSAAEKVLSVCTHCSVGCTIEAEVENGVWTRQNPDFDSPINLGSHCAKGASVREHAIGERRLKYPMKLVGGKWKKVDWETAVNEIGNKMLDIRKPPGPIPCTGSGLPSSTTNSPTCSVNLLASGVPTTSITRPASAIRPRSPALPTPGATAP